MPSRWTGITCVMLFVCNQAAAGELDALLDKVWQTYGGEARIAEARAYRQYGVTFSSLRGREGKVFRAYQHPDHLRVEIDYGDQNTELRVLAGNHAWKQERMVGEPFYSAMLLQAARLGLPATLLEHRDRLRDAGSFTSKEGKTLRAVELHFHGSLHLVAGIDPQTGHIRESLGVIEKQGARMQFGTTYTDFRLHEGRLFAYREGHYAMGRKTGYTRLERIEIVPSLPDELFSPTRAVDEPAEVVVFQTPGKNDSDCNTRSSGRATLPFDQGFRMALDIFRHDTEGSCRRAQFPQRIFQFIADLSFRRGYAVQ